MVYHSRLTRYWAFILLAVTLVCQSSKVSAEDASIVVPQFPVMVSPTQVKAIKRSPVRSKRVKPTSKSTKTATKNSGKNTGKAVATKKTTAKNDPTALSPSFTIHSPMHRRAQKALKSLPSQSLASEAYNADATKAVTPTPQMTPTFKTQPVKTVKSEFSANQLMHFPAPLTAEGENTLEAATIVNTGKNEPVKAMKTVEIITTPVTDSVIMPAENKTAVTPIQKINKTTKSPPPSVTSAVVTTQKPAASPTKTGETTHFKATVMPVSTRDTTLSGKTLPVTTDDVSEGSEATATIKQPDAMSAITPSSTDLKSPELRAEVVKIAKPAIKGDIEAMARIKEMAEMGVPMAQQFLYFYRLANYYFSDGSVCEDCLMVGKNKGTFVLLNTQGKQKQYQFKKLKKRLRKEEYAYHRHHLMDRKGNKYIGLREYLFTPKYMVYVDKEGKKIKVKQTDIRFLTNANTGKIIVDDLSDKSKKTSAPKK